MAKNGQICLIWPLKRPTGNDHCVPFYVKRSKAFFNFLINSYSTKLINIFFAINQVKLLKDKMKLQINAFDREDAFFEPFLFCSSKYSEEL